MSYIRCLSNPESLYIYGTRARDQGDEEILMCIHEGSTMYTMPGSVWEGLCLDWVHGHDAWESASFGGASLKHEKRDKDFKVFLEYEDFSIEMWYVTWDYIVRRYES